MKKEWKIFLTAIMYFTRIRVPATTDHSPVYLQKSPKYFPVIGWVVGGICALVYLVFSQFISANIGIAASMIAGLLTTGAFHEDGFADVCDGFGGGWTKEKILLIMKDSRIGAFGAIGLLAMLGSKFLLLKELSAFTPEPGHLSSSLFYNDRYFILGVIGAHSLSRLMPVFVIQGHENVTDNEHSKSKPVTGRKLTTPELALAILLAFIPFVFLPWPFLGVILPMLYTTYKLSGYFKKWIGGYTGDCLGAIQQVTEIVFYLGFIIIRRYI